MRNPDGMSYIGRKPCGCIVCVIADEPGMRNEVAKFVAKWIKEGLTVERVTHEYVRQNWVGMDCPHTPESAQLPLFDEVTAS